MDKKKYLKCKINILELPDTLINKLEKNNLCFIEDVWKLKRIELRNIDFTNDEINIITIQLQLLGLDLNKKIY